MTRFHEVYSAGTMYGGHHYSATSDGESVHLNEDGITKKEITYSEWCRLNARYECDFSVIAWEIEAT